MTSPARADRLELKIHTDPPPSYSEEAEQAVLSAMLMEPDAVTKARELLNAEMFGLTEHGQLFSTMLALADRGCPIDPLILSEELARTGALEAIGGKDYIGFLVDAVPTAANVEHHAKILRKKAFERRLPEIAERAREMRALGTSAADVAAWNAQALTDAIAKYGDSAQRRIRLLDDLELEELQAPPDLVDGRLPGKVISQLFGPSGNGKTFVALDIACHVATGREWNGCAVEPGPVVYVAAEGIFGFPRRLSAWKKLHGVRGSIPIHFLPVGIPIAVNSPALAELLGEIAKLPTAPVLIVLDTVSRNFAGGSQNDDEAMNRFIDGCILLKNRTGSTILALHHTGWTELERSKGSTAWPQALDTEIRCDRDGERLTLTWTKQRDDEAPSPIALEMVKSGSSLAVKAMDHSGGKLDGNRLVCLRAVHRLEGGATHAQWRSEAGLDSKKSSFSSARNWLLDMAYVKQGARQKYSITDAGCMALGPLVHRQSNASPSTPGPDRSITRGSYKTPGMDQDPHSASGPGSQLTREEEEEYFADQARLKLEAASS